MITKSILYKIYNKSVHCTFSLTIVYLKMLKKGLYIILLVSFFISEAETWYTNPLDYAISRITKRTTFREPISFTPFDIKMGIFNYGGSDYWDQGFGSNKLGISPILLDSSNYEYSGLISDNSRQCYLMEIDFLKYNLPNYVYKQNYVDLQFGLGYKIMGLLDNPGISLPNNFIDGSDTDPTGSHGGSYKYRPVIQDYNINTTINWQFYDFLLAYLYHSVGLSNLSIYQSEGGDKYLKGNGIGESFGLGLKGIFDSRYDRKNYRVTYGLEAKWISSVAYNLKDPNKISPINGFDMRGMGWNINFGIIFGGERSVADLGYQSMIKDDFITAIGEFQEFLDNNPRHIKRLKAQKMLEFCKKQKPYQEFQNGLNAVGNYNLNQAARWYEAALTTANEDLSFEIIVKQKELATILLDSARNYLDEIGFNNAEKLIRKAKAITPKIVYKADEYLSELYMIKADLFYEVKNYEAALKNYEKSYSYNKKIQSDYINKVRQVTNSIVSQANDATNSGDILFALSSLSQLITLRPELEKDLNFGVESLKEKLEELSDSKTQARIQDFIESEKNRAKKRVFNQVEVGMSKDDVIALMGQPAFVENKYTNDQIVEMWFYFDQVEEKYVNFYFEDGLIIRVD